ncbi:putative metallothionein expression activator, partial [Eremomyces bilateralis CBS 781.70]
YEPYPTFNESRRQSIGSQASRHSRSSRSDLEEDPKGLCPIGDCGRVFKDLKAHMLTHQTERPEKCPIQTCEYHVKGFARKYDKNRHTLTHYKGTMVCGFCPGSGSAAEKSFNRADVFKRHLTSVHGVEQTPPNSRKRSPGRKGQNPQNNTSGTCSTCSIVFPTAQEFYEHLDDCVLRVVQQIEPSEAINQKNLESVQNDENVKESLTRHKLSDGMDFSLPPYEDEDDDDADNEESGDGNSSDPRSGKGGIRGTGHVGTRAGLTFSKGGVPFTGQTSGRKRRKNYPTSWGCPVDRMNMKKRVICVYDGPRRLWKDDMMLDREFEVRVNLDTKNYVTDLDIRTLERASALLGATEEEKGPWVPDNLVNVESTPFLI